MPGVARRARWMASCHIHRQGEELCDWMVGRSFGLFTKKKERWFFFE